MFRSFNMNRSLFFIYIALYFKLRRYPVNYISIGWDEWLLCSNIECMRQREWGHFILCMCI